MRRPLYEKQVSFHKVPTIFHTYLLYPLYTMAQEPSPSGSNLIYASDLPNGESPCNTDKAFGSTFKYYKVLYSTIYIIDLRPPVEDVIYQGNESAVVFVFDNAFQYTKKAKKNLIEKNGKKNNKTLSHRFLQFRVHWRTAPQISVILHTAEENGLKLAPKALDCSLLTTPIFNSAYNTVTACCSFQWIRNRTYYFITNLQ